MKPLLVNIDNVDNGLPLDRIPLGESTFSERKLQEVLSKYPELLAVDQVDPVFAPAVCIGKETATGAGPLDVLYISPQGYLTIVETKLWRNPQARREVIAQVVDYAKQIARWDYARLEEAFLQYAKAQAINAKSLYDFVCEASQEDVEEIPFIDSVERNLRQGRFLMLIVGDGIHENVASMASYLLTTPNLNFNLQLMEIACYGMPDGNGSVMLVPSIIARTVEVERAVVRIEMSSEAEKKVNVITTIPEVPGKSPRSRMSRQEFLERLAAKVGAEQAAKVEAFVDRLLNEYDSISEEFTKNRLAIKLEFTKTDRPPQSILYIHATGYVHTRPQLCKFAQRNGVTPSIIESYFDRLKQIAPGLSIPRRADGTWYRSKSDFEPLVELLPKLDQVGDAIVKLINDVEVLDE